MLGYKVSGLLKIGIDSIVLMINGRDIAVMWDYALEMVELIALGTTQNCFYFEILI
jgi:hypothetical protein